MESLDPATGRFVGPIGGLPDLVAGLEAFASLRVERAQALEGLTRRQVVEMRIEEVEEQESVLRFTLSFEPRERIVDGLVRGSREVVARREQIVVVLFEAARETESRMEQRAVDAGVRRVARGGEAFGQRREGGAEDTVRLRIPQGGRDAAGEDRADRGERPGCVGVGLREGDGLLGEGVHARRASGSASEGREPIGAKRVDDDQHDRRRPVLGGWTGASGGDDREGHRDRREPGSRVDRALTRRASTPSTLRRRRHSPAPAHRGTRRRDSSVAARGRSSRRPLSGSRPSR